MSSRLKLFSVLCLLFLASSGFSQYSDAYLKCRCGQANFAPATMTQCCGYGVIPPGHSQSECVDCSTYTKGCSAAAGGGYVVGNSGSGPTNCTSCCGSSSWSLGSQVTCGSNSYNYCTCTKTITPSWNFNGGGQVAPPNPNIPVCPSCMGGIPDMNSTTNLYNLKGTKACYGLNGCSPTPMTGTCQIYQSSCALGNPCPGPNNPLQYDIWTLTCS